MSYSEDDMDNSISEFEDIKQELKEVKDQLAVLTETIKKLVNVCSRMNEHIDFVEETYEVVKHPINFITSKFNGEQLLK